MQVSDVVSVLQRYRNVTPATAPASVNQDFQQVVQNVPSEHLAAGLSEAFRSDKTPPFGTMVGSLFGQSSGEQRAGILNQLIGSLGPSALSSGALSGVLGGLSGLLGSRGTTVTPDVANQVPADVVEKIAEHAQNQNPSIVDQASSFYAQHPKLVQALGAGSLALIMSHMSRR